MRKRLLIPNRNLTTSQTPSKVDYAIPNFRTVEEVVFFLQNNPLHFIANYLYIIDKSAHKVKLVPNFAQLSYLQSRTSFDLILKARQLGFSTIVLGMLFHRVVMFANQICAVIAHDKESTAKLFRRIKFMYDNLPPFLKWERSSDSKTEIAFKANNSYIAVLTAGTDTAGRSMTLNAALCSEVAFWPGNAEAMIGIMDALTPDPDSWIVWESTANGVGGLFYDEWMAAENGESRFKPHFYSWFLDPGYQIPLLSEQKKDMKKTLDEKEQGLYNDCGVTLEQLAWRREKRRTQIGRETFEQEFPATPQEAFRSSGQPVFDQGLLARLSPKVPLSASMLPMELAEISEGLDIWKLPEPDKTYVVFADCAEGLENNDYDSVDVLETNTGEQCAQIHGHYGPAELAHRISMLGYYYRDALVGVERNNHGHAVLLALIEGTSVLEPYRGELFYHIDGRPGWHTTPTSKPLMVRDLHESLHTGDVIVNSQATLMELGSFVYQNGRMEGVGKGRRQAHDDRVISICGAEQVRRYALRPNSVYSQDRLAKKLKELRESRSVFAFGG